MNTNLKFCFNMTNKTESHIIRSYFTLRCIPQDTERQKIIDLDIKISPHDTLSESVDEFGNKMYVGQIFQKHDVFSLDISGSAVTGLNVYEEVIEDKNLSKAAIYKYPTVLTANDCAVSDYYEKLQLSKYETAYDKAVFLNSRLAADFEYKKEVTHVNTTAGEALSGTGGVCQDYAHIMLALLRIDKIPCRYVTGLLVGEGESHAWVEVLCGKYWYGFDPTNRALVAENYIKLSHGRDAKDCLINKGVFYGGGNQKMSVMSRVETEGVQQ